VIHKKLGFRIGLTVALSIFAIEIIIGFFTLHNERSILMNDRVKLLNLTAAALEGDMVRSIQNQNFQSLGQTLSDVAGNFDALCYTLFDSKGKIFIQEILKPEHKLAQDDFRERLVWTQVNQKYWVEIVKSPDGSVLRYLTPIYNADKKIVGGLDVEMPIAGIDKAVRMEIYKMTAIAFLIALFSVSVISVVVFYFVIRPINEMKMELVALSKGQADLTFRINIPSEDEIGEMARWFNAFIERIRIMVSRVMEHSKHLSEQVQTMTQSTDEVSAMSGDVTTTVQQIAKGAEEQATKVAEVNHLMQEMQDTMKEVEKKAQETSFAVDRATQTAKAGGKMAKVTIDKMVELNSIIMKNSEMVSHLGAKSQQVGRVVELISGIAEQTNLLSLNAAIEAARAGEQGRGFAVVAEEIRSLADRASASTQEITTLVQEIQDETAAVVASMDKSGREAQIGKDGIRQMEGVLDEIISVIENVVQHSHSITEMTGSQSHRYTKIVHSIQDINAVSEESAASTEEVSASTEEQSASMEQVNATCKELSAMAEELKSMVEKFKIR
jgi:methyl-accepting chemotaxis protein